MSSGHKKCFQFVSAIVLAVWTCSVIVAQESWPLDVQRGKPIVLKIPGKLLGFEKVSFWDGTLKYGAIIERSKNGLMVTGVENWTTSGWPLMFQLTLQKISRQNQQIVLELQGPLFKINLRFSKEIADLSKAFAEVAFRGTLEDFKQSEYYQRQVIGQVLPTIFTGKLAEMPEKSKLRILEILKFVDSAVKTEKYKGETFLAIDIGSDTQVYNTIRVDQTQRVGHCLNQTVLSYLKLVARTIRFNDNVDGLKISLLVPYKNFVTEAYLNPSFDRIDIYTPMEVIRQFADNELAVDEVVDESVLLVNGNKTRLTNVKSL